MGNVLSQKEIDELLNSLKSGDVKKKMKAKLRKK